MNEERKLVTVLFADVVGSAALGHQHDAEVIWSELKQAFLELQQVLQTHGASVEKLIGEDSLFNRLFIKYYYDMKKRNGYSELEIAQKREALENVLIPYKLMENREMLLRAGFRYCDVFFKWYNFCGIIAVK